MICSKTPGFFRYLAMLLVASSVCLAGASTGFALNIESSTLDGSVVVEPSAKFITGLNNEPRDILIGRDQCESLWESDTRIKASYNFTRTVLTDSCFGANPCIERIMFFAVPADNPPEEFSCTPENSQNCVDIDEVNWFGRENETDSGLDIYVDFRRMINEAVGELDSSNEVSPIENIDDCNQEGDAAISQQYFLRIFMKNIGVDSDQEESSDVRIEIDTERPDGPTEIKDIEVTEQNIFATWTQSGVTDLEDYRVYWSAEDFSGMSIAEIEESDSVYSRLINLDNPDPSGSEYSGSASLTEIPDNANGHLFVAVSSRDLAENTSEPTFPDETLDPEGDGFEILEVTDFWEHYREAGGSERGGCNSVAGGRAGGSPALPGGWLFAIVGIGMLALGRRGSSRSRQTRANPTAPQKHRRSMNTWWVALVLLGGALAFAPDAHAESNTYGISEIRLGFYYPAIDDEAGLSGSPFGDIFGDSHRVLGEYEMGYHFFDGFGALGVSGRVGYTNFSGDVLINNASDGSQTPSTAIGEQTELMVIPLGVSLYYRFDILEKYWSIPLVPVVKGGLDYAFWSIDSNSGDASTYEGDEGSGATAGWHVAGALHLWLDWIEPESAASFDRTWGINNSYLFAEYSMRTLDDFGSANSFDLSDNMWVFGLAFEY